jgi:ABC-type Zn uptake system ZnuABC Zn-binding protein ZnuA
VARWQGFAVKQVDGTNSHSRLAIAFWRQSNCSSFAFGAQAQERLTVVATTGMIADAAREVGGDLVEVSALMGPGVDPHAYRQTRSDIVATANAELVLWHGLYLEAQMEEFLLELGETRPVAVADICRATF